MVWCRGGGGGGGGLYRETTQEWVTFFTVQIFFPGSDNIKGRGTQKQFSENICSEDDLRSEHLL